MGRNTRCCLVLVWAVGLLACGTPAKLGKNVQATDALGDAPDGGVSQADAPVVTDPDVAPDAPPDLGKDVKPQCTKDADCTDQNPCTDDFCMSEKCTNSYNVVACDDGNPCTTNDFCNAGTCVGSGTCVDIVADTGSADSSADTSDSQASDAAADTGGTTTGCSAAEWQSTQGDGFIGKMNTCATQCVSTPTKDCFVGCIKPAGSLSDKCANCMGDLAECAATKCLTDCLQATSSACKGCAAKNCGAALSKCSGFAAPDCESAGDCNDKDACTTDTCTAMFCGHASVACDDGKACTADSCDSKQGCQHADLPGTVTCEDGDACTTGDACAAGACAGSKVSCEDGLVCTADSCDMASGCTHTALDSGACSDGNACTVGDGCSAGVCLAGAATDCGDGDACTTDACVPATGCAHAAVDSNDHNACTTDACDALAGVSHTAVAVDDNNACTIDACDAVTGVSHAPITVDDSDACTTDACDPLAGVQHTTVVTNDNNVCTIDACDAKTGVSHTPVDLDDGVTCTTDACDPIAGPSHLPATGPACEDGNPCTTADVCKDGACGGTAKTCDDTNACTTDACGLAGDCTHTDTSANCVDGLVCTDDSCVPASGCHYTNNKAACDDGNVCTVSETCDGGACGAGSAKPCSDGNGCTTDTCAHPGGCAHTNLADGVTCTDGDACTISDVCGTGVCLAGAATPCDDGQTCTLDACDSKSGLCTYSPAATGLSCDDGNPCTTGDACTASGLCAGTGSCPPPVCTTEPRLILDPGSSGIQILGVALSGDNVLIALNGIGGGSGTGKVVSCPKLDGCGASLAGADVLKSGMVEPTFLVPHDDRVVIGDIGSFGSGAADGVVLDCDVQGCDVNQVSVATGQKSMGEVLYMGGSVAWYAYNGGPSGVPGIGLYDLGSQTLVGKAPLDGANIGMATDGVAIYSSSQYSPTAIRKTDLSSTTTLLGDASKGGGAHRYGLSVAGGWLYWAASLTPTAGIWRMTTAGASVEQVKADADSPRNILVDGDTVYYKNYYGGADLKAVSLIDGSVRVLASGWGQSQGWPYHRILAVDGQCVYWGTLGGSVYTVQK